MGNRAFITDREKKVGVYLHWNGGRDSVEGFLKYCEMKGYSGMGRDSSYAFARLAQVIGNFFGGGTSVGISTQLNYEDNGTYVVDGWSIVERIGWEDGKEIPFPEEWEQHEYTLEEMLQDIDSAQPEEGRLGELLEAEKVKRGDVRIGDTVFVRNWDETIGKYTVVGFGDDRVANGHRVFGLPIINKYTDENGVMLDNPNNYIKEEYVWRK